MKTYFVKGYGYHECGSKCAFSIVFDLEDVNSKSFSEAVEKSVKLSPYRRNKAIWIDSVVVLN